MTLEELSRNDGKDGRPAYIAYKGDVYDVSESKLWKNGEHQGQHSAGVDLTESLQYAPHGVEVFGRFEKVARLDAAKNLMPKDKEKISAKEKWREWYQVNHPHPILAHFPIALHIFAAGMNTAFLFSPLEKFEQGAYYAFLFATLFGFLATIAGTLSWWVNYGFSTFKPLVIKFYTAIFLLLIASIGLTLHMFDPTVAYNRDAAALFYHFSIFIAVPCVMLLGFFGGKLTWGKETPTSETTKSETSEIKTNATPELKRTKAELLSQNDFTIMIGGAAGSGIKTIETLLTDAFSSMGYCLFSTKEFMSRVKGGSNTVQIRISDKTVKAAKWKPDLFLAFDELSVSHVKDRIGLDTCVIGGQNEEFSNHLKISLQEEALKYVTKQFVNTFSVGVLFGLLKLPLETIEDALKKRFHEKDYETNLEAVNQGYLYAKKQNVKLKKLPSPSKKSDEVIRYIDGTTATGFGFLAGGCNSVTSYPMSPSTGVLTFLAEMSKDFDIAIEQAEDEIAALNMVLGVWYAGGRGLTTTSGGGFALMSETMSLSGMTETPAVVYLAQRPGPATGLPTRTEQGDLNLALYAGHGEFPRLILAPGDALESLKLGHLAFEMADRFQIPALLLSDQYLADSVQSISEIDFKLFSQNRYITKSKADYLRYKLTEDGISERAIPGYGEGLVCCDSDEHDERGQITESYKVRETMVEKRKQKHQALCDAAIAPEIIGDGKIAIVGWGSTKGVISEVLFMLDDANLAQVHFSWIYPLNKEHLVELSKMDLIIVVENNSNAQFADLLKLNDIKVDATILQSNGFPFFSDVLVEDIAQKVKELS